MKIPKSFRIEETLWNEVEKIARLEDRSCSMQIVHFIRQGVELWRMDRKSQTEQQAQGHSARTSGRPDRDR